MLTADRVDILVSFIKWAGLRLLMPGFEDLLKRGVMVRVITTSYLGPVPEAGFLAGSGEGVMEIIERPVFGQVKVAPRERITTFLLR